jgi:hypothetical protein
MPDTDAASMPTAPGTAFESYLKAGEFRLQTCRACATQIYYPRTLCSRCGACELEWRLVSGRGAVYSTTVVRQKPERGGDYNVAIVELEEGARFLSRVEGIPPAEVRIAMPVVAFIDGGTDMPQVLFRPARAEQ